jgi:hypothetical protein
METVLAGLQWHICLIYLDDIIVMGLVGVGQFFITSILDGSVATPVSEITCPKNRTSFEHRQHFFAFSFSPAF